MTPAELDKAILGALAGTCLTLPDLQTRVPMHARLILKRLHVLQKYKKVVSLRDGDTLAYALRSTRTRRSATEPGPRRCRGDVVKRVREILRQAPYALNRAEVIIRAEGIATDDIIGNVLSSRTKAGEFQAIPPTGRNRCYRIAPEDAGA